MFQNTPLPLKIPSQVTLLFKPNGTMVYHYRQWCNNEHNNLDSYFPFLKPPLEAFKFIHILNIIQVMKV